MPPDSSSSQDCAVVYRLGLIDLFASLRAGQFIPSLFACTKCKLKVHKVVFTKSHNQQGYSIVALHYLRYLSSEYISRSVYLLYKFKSCMANGHYAWVSACMNV